MKVISDVSASERGMIAGRRTTGQPFISALASSPVSAAVPFISGRSASESSSLPLPINPICHAQAGNWEGRGNRVCIGHHVVSSSSKSRMISTEDCTVKCLIRGNTKTLRFGRNFQGQDNVFFGGREMGRARTAPVGRGKKAGKGPRLRFSTELGRRGRGLTARARTPPRRLHRDA